MTNPEQPKAAADQAGERVPEAVPLSRTLDDYQRALGLRRILPSPQATVPEAQATEANIMRKGTVDSFHEGTAAYVALYQKKAVREVSFMERRDAALQDPRIQKKLDKRDTSGEFVLATQLATYNEGLSDALQFIADITRRYQDVVPVLDTLNPADRALLQGKEVQAQQVIRDLTHLASVWTVQDNLFHVERQLAMNARWLHQYEEKRNDPRQRILPEEQRTRDQAEWQQNGLLEKHRQLLGQLQVLVQEERKATFFPGNEHVALNVQTLFAPLGNALNGIDANVSGKSESYARFLREWEAQEKMAEEKDGKPNLAKINVFRAEMERRLIYTASGDLDGDGKPDKALPQDLIIEILTKRYDQLLEGEKAFIDARKGDLSASDLVAVKAVRAELESLMFQIAQFTNISVQYHEHMTGLAVQQRSLGPWNTEGAFAGAANVAAGLGESDPGMKKRLEEGMKQMRDFHLGRFIAIMDIAEKDFTPDDPRAKASAEAMQGLDDARLYGGWIAKALRPLSESAEVAVQDFLMEPILEGMEWPKDDKGRRLTIKEMEQAVAGKTKDWEKCDACLKKIRGTKEIFAEFQRTSHIGDIRDTVQAIKMLEGDVPDTSAQKQGEDGIHAAVQPPKVGIPNAAILQEFRGVKDMKSGAVHTTIQEWQKKGLSHADAVATMHTLLVEQLAEQWGSVDFVPSAKDPNILTVNESTATGFVGAYARMIKKIEGQAGLQLDIYGLLLQQKAWAERVFKYAILAVGVAIPAALAAPFLPSAVSLGVRGTAGLARLGFRAVHGGLKLAGHTLTSSEALSESLTRMSSSAYTRVFAGAYALEGAYEAYSAYKGREETVERLTEAKGQISAQLLKLGFQESEGGWVHPNLPGVKINAKALESAADQQTTMQTYKMVSGGAKVAVGLTALALSTGPAGIVVLVGGTAILLTVDGYLKSESNKVVRDLIADPNCPAWLLTLLGTEGLTGKRPFELLDMASREAYQSSTEAEKMSIREKMLFVLFNREIEDVDPELRKEILAGAGQEVGRMQSFFDQDFREKILPHVYLRLIQMSAASGAIKGGSISEEDIRSGRVTERGANEILTFHWDSDVSEMSVRQAMREAAVLYVQHTRERRYLRFLQRKAELEAQLAKEESGKTRQELADVNYILEICKKEKVFGATLGEGLSTDAIAKNGGKTRAELLMYELQERGKDPLQAQVRDTAGTRYMVTATEVPGLPKAFSLSEWQWEAEICDDPAKRQAYLTIYPQRVTEPEAVQAQAQRVEQLEVNEGFRPVVPWNLKEAVRISQESAQAVGAQSPAKVAPEQATEEANRNQMTLNVLVAMQRLREMPTEQGKKRNLREEALLDERFAQEKYPQREGYEIPPAVFFIGNAERSKVLVDPLLSGSAFEHQNLVAVIFEAGNNASGNIALSTFVYQQPTSGEFVFVQRGMTLLSDGKSFVQGENNACNQVTFLRQPGAADLLALVQQQLPLRQRRIDELHNQRTSAAEALKRDLEKAEETAKGHPQTFVAYPGDQSESDPYGSVCRYVAYLPGAQANTGCFLYMRVPEVDDGNLTIRASIPGKEADVQMPVSQTMVGVRQEGERRTYYFSLKGDIATMLQKKYGPEWTKYDGILRSAVEMPIDGADLFAVRKLLALYVSDINAPEARLFEAKVMKAYGPLTYADGRKFLGYLQSELLHRLRSDGSVKALTESILDEALEKAQEHFK